DSTFSAMYLRQESSCKDAVCNVVEHLVHPGRRQKRDNPILRGYAALNGLTGWQIITTGANPTETYGGSAAPMIVTSPPSIISEFAKSSFVPALMSATAVVYTSTLA